jgi:hypothetical protein
MDDAPCGQFRRGDRVELFESLLLHTCMCRINPIQDRRLTA